MTIRNLSSNAWLPVSGVILLGAIIRLAHLAFIDLALPKGSGGLFLEFAQQIVAHDYMLPDRIPFYTEGGIPFAYPPLPFYAEAVLIDIFSFPPFLAATVLPPFIAVLTLPSFYLLTRQLELRPLTRIVALLAYAVLPAAFQQQTEVAGLAEAFGSLALIWLAISMLRAYKSDTVGRYALVGLFWAICIGASPGSAYAAVPTFLIFASVQLARPIGRVRIRTVVLLGVAAIIAVVAASPYWLPVTGNHGVHVFSDSFVAQHGGGFESLHRALRTLARFAISGAEANLLWDVVILFGAVSLLLRRQWALLAWFLVLLIIPREGDWLAAVPAALLAGIGATELLAPLLVGLGKSYLRKPEQMAVSAGFALLLTAYALANAVVPIHATVVSESGVSYEALDALRWAKENTPAESKFLVLSRSQVLEWAPHIARRTVLNTSYGAEWKPEEMRTISMLQEELWNCPTLDCIGRVVAEIEGYDEVYLYADRNQLARLMSASRGETATFELMWENSEAAVGHLSIIREVP